MQIKSLGASAQDPDLDEAEMSKGVTVKDFRTPDLYFAAYLQTAGVELKRTDRENNRIYFIFDTSLSNIEELKTGWFSNTAKVPAQPYANSIKSLKSICHMQ